MPSSVLESPLRVDAPEEIVDRPSYNDAEEVYLKNLRTKLENARNQRDQEHQEFDGMSYTTHYDTNERVANTYVQPKKNKEDTNFKSGTVRQKLFALLSALVNLNLDGDISAFDSEGLQVQGLGDALEDVLLKTKELDGDEEKKYLRQYELLKHGTVFVEQIWDERMKKEKNVTGSFSGSVKDVTWKTKLTKAFSRPSRNIIPGLNVYLGDMTKYDISEQPFVFTVDSMPYEEAKLVFGSWERWKNVPRKFAPVDDTASLNWRLLESRENHVEIVRYQDKWNNEFAVMLNGVLMTPMELPLPWGYEEYNIAQQNLEPIHSKFAYGKSLVSRIKNKVALLDEFDRLAILKTQKSFMPPRYNVSGRILSNRVFMPGKLNHGLAPNSLPPIEGENEGVTQAEMAMIKHIQESIDMETTSPTFSGQAAQSGTTATEIVELQRQAKMILGLTVFAMTMLEWKLEWLLLQTVLAKWFKPEDTVVDAARGHLKGKYRQVSVERPIEGEGMGRRVVIPTKEIPSEGAIMQAEDALTDEQGMPVRLIFLDPDEVCSSKLVWQIVVRPKERKSSETEKLMFRAFLQDAMAFGPMLNLEYLGEKLATVWGEDASKLFKSPDQVQMEAEQAQQAQAGTGAVSPRVSLPSPEKAAGKEMRASLGVTQ